MSKFKDEINIVNNLIERVENPSLRKRIDNVFDIFEVTGKVALNEGFLKSYDASAIINSLQKKFNLATNKVEFDKSQNFEGYIHIDYAREKPVTQYEYYTGGKPINDEIVILEMLLPEGNYSERVEKFMSACGWYRAYIEQYGKRKGYMLSVFEKRMQSTEGVKINECHFLYHLVPTSRVDKIMKNGLCPKSGCKMGFHPERVYLFKDKLSEREIYNWISQLSAFEKNEKAIENGYTLLKVNVDGLGLDFYADPNLDGAVYTRDNISPSAISIEKKY